MSPPRYGWISFWGMPEPCDELLVELARTLECAGVVFTLDEDWYWLMEVYRDERRVAYFGAPSSGMDELASYEEARDAT